MNSRSHCGIKRQAREQMVLFSEIIMLFPVCIQILMCLKPSDHLFSSFLNIRGFSVSFILRQSSVFSHMIEDMKDLAGNWIAEPPSYEPIVAEDKNVHNLNEYIEIRDEGISTNVGAELINGVSNMKLGVAMDENHLGVAMNENQLEEFFSQVSQ
ncbi:hypothetical protein Q3G72_013835 [Acer saccharum]|nr:hypothetical protein Q3G72_013835 [Acer saccharum]